MGSAGGGRSRTAGISWRLFSLRALSLRPWGACVVVAATSGKTLIGFFIVITGAADGGARALMPRSALGLDDLRLDASAPRPLARRRLRARLALRLFFFLLLVVIARDLDDLVVARDAVERHAS